MKKYCLFGAASLALSIATPASAQAQQAAASTTGADQNTAGADEFTMFFSQMFAKDDTPIDPILLAKGERVAAAVVPKGSYRKIMAETFKTVLEPMMAQMDQMPLSAIAAFTGVEEKDISLKDDATLSDLMMIVDPHFKQRNIMMMRKMSGIMIDLSDEIEPSIRQGMARAYAKRFSSEELESVADFYATEAGAKFAGESLFILASPEVMSASVEIMPKFMEQFFGEMEEISKGSDDIPPPRDFGDLSEAERAKLSELLGIDEEDLNGPNVAAVD